MAPQASRKARRPSATEASPTVTTPGATARVLSPVLPAAAAVTVASGWRRLRSVKQRPAVAVQLLKDRPFGQA